ASHGLPTSASTGSKSRSTTSPGSRWNWPRLSTPTRGASGVLLGSRRQASTKSGSAPPTPPATPRPKSSHVPPPTVPRDGTRSGSPSTPERGRGKRSETGLSGPAGRPLPRSDNYPTTTGGSPFPPRFILCPPRSGGRSLPPELAEAGGRGQDRAVAKGSVGVDGGHGPGQA